MTSEQRQELLDVKAELEAADAELKTSIERLERDVLDIGERFAQIEDHLTSQDKSVSFLVGWVKDFSRWAAGIAATVATLIGA